MKVERRGMVWLGSAMTIIGCGVVFVWLGLESASTFKSAPVATIIGIVVVLGLLALLVPVPLILAIRRANARGRMAARPAALVPPEEGVLRLQSGGRDSAG
jgi:uncharacterized membrane protein YhaH (DUF805 family)